MKIIVTGGAGFIGGNFVHYMSCKILPNGPEMDISTTLPKLWPNEKYR